MSAAVFGVRWPDAGVEGWSHHMTLDSEEERDRYLAALLPMRPAAVKCDCGRHGVFRDRDIFLDCNGEMTRYRIAEIESMIETLESTGVYDVVRRKW